MLRTMIALLLLAACTPQAGTGDAISSLASACTSACDGYSEEAATLQEGDVLYTTSEAVCIKQGRRLYCGTCACGTYGPEEAMFGPLEGTATLRCAFNGSDATRTLTVECGTV